MNLEEAVAILRNSLNEEDKEQRDRIAKQLVKAIKTGNKELERRINRATENMRVKVKDSKPTENKVGMNEAIELLESVRDQITKKYGGMFDKGLSNKGLSKHKKSIENNVNELISAAKRNLPNEEKNSSIAIDREANKIEARRNNTKNKIGAYKTDLHTIGYGGKLRSWSELGDNREEDKKNGYKKAIDKSIRRHNEKVSLKEALELMEAIINEVSVGALARATENNNQKRRDDAAKAIRGYRKSRSEYNKLADKYPEEEPGLYRKMSADDEAAVKVVNKKDHLEDLKKLNLPKDSKVSANKLFKVAHKVEGKRDKELDTNKKAKEFVRALDRSQRADNIIFADPVKSRANEALTIVEEMLSLANSIFEVAPEAAQQAEVPPSENKIKRTVKDKDSKKDKEVVSVADELFPYEGNAKQQMNQKILAKINQMIEGTATLEDLLQLVRKGSNVKKAGIKESFDRAEAMLKELINEVSKDWTGKRLKAGNEKEQQINKETEEILGDKQATEEEKNKAALKRAKYRCKNINACNKAYNYEESKVKNKKETD